MLYWTLVFLVIALMQRPHVRHRTILEGGDVLHEIEGNICTISRLEGEVHGAHTLELQFDCEGECT